MNGPAHSFATPIPKTLRNGHAHTSQRIPNMTDGTGGASLVAAAEEDSRTLLFRQRYLQTEARLAALFRAQDALPDPRNGQLSQSQSDDAQNTPNKPSGPPKKPTRAIDEDDYGDEDDEDEDEVETASPLLQMSALAVGNGNRQSPATPFGSHLGKPTLERTLSTDQSKTSEDARKQAEEDKEAAEEAAKRRFHTLFYTLENDRTAMIEQQKLDELDRQVEAETSGQSGAPSNPTAATSVPQQGSLSSANLGASSLMLKNLLSTIDKKRHMVHANDAQLRRLISESRKNRSKWASEDKINQEDLYEAAEKVLHELKAMTEHSAPFLQRVSKREAPDYYTHIKNPMDIGTMMKKLKGLQYKSKKEFVEDLHLIWNNCLRYNTDPQHFLRKKALIMQKQTDKLVVLIPDLVVRDRAEVEAEERRNASLDADLDGEDSDDEEPIMASRGRKAPSKKSKKGGTTTRKAPPSINEGTPGAETKPQLGSNGSSSNIRNNFLRADSDIPMENGFTPPPGNLTPLRLNGLGPDAESQADPSEGDGTAMGDLAVEPSEDPEADDYEYQIWKQVTKKARATIASERARLFHNDRLNPEEPALLRTKAGMRRWTRQQKKLEPQDEVTTDPSTPETGKEPSRQDVPGETLTEGMEGEDDTLLPDYYDPLSAIPEVEDQLKWEEDGEGNVVMHAEETLRMIPKGHFLSPQSALTKKIEANMRQMQETRKICTKIGVVKQMQLQAQVG
jgi:transcriptional activator SPT7